MAHCPMVSHEHELDTQTLLSRAPVRQGATESPQIQSVTVMLTGGVAESEEVQA